MKLPFRKQWHPSEYEVDVELRRPSKKESLMVGAGCLLLVGTLACVIAHSRHCESCDDEPDY